VRAFTPDPKPVFDSCGGEILGSFRATSIRVQGLLMHPSAGHDCETRVTSQPTSTDLVMDFQLGILVKVSMSALGVGFTTQSSCVAQVSSCDSIRGDINCRSQPCGECACTASLSLAADEWVWAVWGQTLTLTSGTSHRYDFLFCRQGNILHLYDQAGGMLTDLERVYAVDVYPRRLRQEGGVRMEDESDLRGDSCSVRFENVPGVRHNTRLHRRSRLQRQRFGGLW